MRNTLKLLIDLGALLKKPASETTYFKLLVLVFRVFALLSSQKAFLFIGGQKKLNTVSLVTEASKMTQCWEAVQFESDVSLKWLWIKTSSCFHSTPIFIRNPLLFVSGFISKIVHFQGLQMILLLQQFLSSILISQRMIFVEINLVSFIQFEKQP